MINPRIGKSRQDMINQFLSTCFNNVNAFRPKFSSLTKVRADELDKPHLCSNSFVISMAYKKSSTIEMLRIEQRKT